MGTVRSRSRTPALPRARCPLALRRHDARRRREPDLPDRDALCAVPAPRARRPRMRSCAERGCSLRESVITPDAAAIEQRRLWANPWRAHAGCTTEPERVSHTTTGSGVVLMLAVSLWFYDGRGSRTLSAPVAARAVDGTMDAKAPPIATRTAKTENEFTTGADAMTETRRGEIRVGASTIARYSHMAERRCEFRVDTRPQEATSVAVPQPSEPLRAFWSLFGLYDEATAACSVWSQCATLAFAQAQKAEPQKALDDCVFAGHRNMSVINPNAVGIKERRIGASL